jgi:hypothetical protein
MKTHDGYTFFFFLRKITVGEDVEELRLSYIAGGNVKWFVHGRKYFGAFSKS